MKVLAGIVLFNPDIVRLNENIKAIYSQVDSVVLVDNGSQNIDDIKALVSSYKGLKLLTFSKNKGIATALCRIMRFGIDNGYDWVLTLDQDSVCSERLIEHYSYFWKMKDVGILTCDIIDRNFVVDSCFDHNERYKEVSQCITSASLVNVRAYLQTDGFDRKMFIDSVDFDICINMRKHGFKIIKVNYKGVLHEVGHGKNVKLLFKNYIAYNHSPFRQYYKARNHKYLAYKYPDEFSKTRELLREIREEMIIIIFEDDKIAKLKQRWKGLCDAKKMLSSR